MQKAAPKIAPSHSSGETAWILRCLHARCLDHSEQHPHFLTKLFLYTKRCCVTNQLRIILIPSFCVLPDCIIKCRHIHRLAAPNHIADRAFQVVGVNQMTTKRRDLN